MKKQDIVAKTEQYVMTKMLADSTGHDWQHVQRVRNLAIMLGEIENADLFIVEMAALLHDLDDYKITNNLSGQLTLATYWLNEVQIDISTSKQITNIISQMSYKGAEVDTKMDSLEGCVVQDADRLDAIGAIGIARTFMYGGAKGRQLYNAQDKPLLHKTFQQYQTNTSSTINHFYEKLLLLKDRMNTKAAKQIAEKRHRFMIEFLTQFHNEWEASN